MRLFIPMVWALTLTLILEVAFALAWGLRKEKLLLVVLMNILTNPAANALYSFMTVYLHWPMLWVTLGLECAVIAVEGLCCRGLLKRPWLFALSINAFSYIIGLLLQQLL